MKFDSTTFAASLELSIVLFCAFSLVYLGNLRREQNRWLLLAYFALGFPFVNLLLGAHRYHLLPYTPFLQNPAPILLFFPALYLYTRKLLPPKTLPQGGVYPHFIPFVLFYWIFVILGFEQPEALLLHSRPPWHIAAFIGFNALHALVYLYLTYKLVQYAQSHYQEQFADDSPFITLSWIQWMIYIIGSVALLRLSMTAFAWVDGATSRNLTLGSILLVMGILNYFSFRQPAWYTGQQNALPPLAPKLKTPKLPSRASLAREQALAPSSILEEEKARYIERLEHFMKTEQPFLNPKIRMPELAAALEIPRHVFSSLINEHYQVNFFHFINKYRVAYAKELLRSEEYEKYTLESISEFAGFNSRSTFNRIFKNATGQSPKEFQASKR